MKTIALILSLCSAMAFAEPHYVTVNSAKNPIVLKGCSCDAKGKTKGCPKDIKCNIAPAKKDKKK